MSKLKNKIKEGLNEVSANDLGKTLSDMEREVKTALPSIEDDEAEEMVKTAVMGSDDENSSMTQTGLSEEDMYEVNDEVMQSFIDQYGKEKGEQIYYATANKQGRDPEDFHMDEIKRKRIIPQHKPNPEYNPDPSIDPRTGRKKIIPQHKPNPEYNPDPSIDPRTGRKRIIPQHKPNPSIDEIDGDVSRGIEYGMNPESGEVNYDELNKLIADLNASGEFETGDNMGGNLEIQDYEDLERENRRQQYGNDIYEGVNPRMTKDELVESVIGHSKNKPKVIKRIKVKDIRNGK